MSIHCDISRCYARGRIEPVLRDISLTVDSGSILIVIGPTGIGKTTLLDQFAFSRTSSLASVDRKLVGYLQQDPTLLPWRNGLENATLAAELYGFGSLSALEWFELFKMGADALKLPAQMSGGMQQRVALIRTLLPGPDTLLLDEPFTGLDFETKLAVQRFLIDYLADCERSALIVTHDIEDAIALGDRVVVLGGSPATIVREHIIDLNGIKRDPVEARKSPRFADYFTLLWESLQQANT